MTKALRLLEYAGFLLAVYPVILLGAFLTLAVLFRASVGYWPSLNNPRPPQPEWQSLYLTVFFGTLLIPLISFCALLIALGGRLQARQFRCWKITAVAVLSLAALSLYGWADPGGLVKWFWR